MFAGNTQERGYREAVGANSTNSDWPFQSLSEDADLYQNAYALTSRCRDLFKCNPLYIKYRESLWAKVLGEKGPRLRSKIKETEDRVVYAPDEKAALRAHEDRINRVRAWAAEKAGTELQSYRAFHLADGLDRAKPDDVIRGKAMIQVGASDVYANLQVEAAWNEWQRPEFCDIRGRRTYNTLRQLRLISAVRDGDFFIRKIKSGKRNPDGTWKLNKFGFSLQLINAEWCDRFYNAVLPSGNVVIMGIEYQMTDWGLGKPVAFYFIKRQPNDWQFSMAGGFNFSSGSMHIRVDADEIIHYARPVDADSTRPAPWTASAILKGRQLDQFELAEVIAAREDACRLGVLYSDTQPEGGDAQYPINPKDSLPHSKPSPGDLLALKYGVKYQPVGQTRPSGNFDPFRKGMVRSTAAGMPGADYNTLANDLEGINFSAGRLGRLDTDSITMVIQSFDEGTAECPIYEDQLEMGLITGAIPLPLNKYPKFNRKVFAYKKSRQVDEVKEVNAAALRISNKLTSRNQECDDIGSDFETVAMEQAEEQMLLESLGLSAATTADAQPATIQMTEDDPEEIPKKPAKKD